MTDKPIQLQAEELVKIVYKNSNVKAILYGNPFPKSNNWYLGAGCITQSVWNYLSKKNPDSEIKDYDLIAR